MYEDGDIIDQIDSPSFRQKIKHIARSVGLKFILPLGIIGGLCFIFYINGTFSTLYQRLNHALFAPEPTPINKPATAVPVGEIAALKAQNKADMRALTERLDHLQDTLGQIQTQQPSPPQQPPASEIRYIKADNHFARLVVLIQNGHSFTDALAAAKPHLLPMHYQTLKPYAESGIATRLMLIEELRLWQNSRTAMASAPATRSFWGTHIDKLSGGLIQVKRVQATPQLSSFAALREALLDNDLTRLQSIIAALSPDVKTSLDAWQQRLDAHIALTPLINTLRQEMLTP